jgi:hypothetical protein
VIPRALKKWLSRYMRSWTLVFTHRISSSCRCPSPSPQQCARQTENEPDESGELLWIPSSGTAAHHRMREVSDVTKTLNRNESLARELCVDQQ